jgi:hypothetical protein
MWLASVCLEIGDEVLELKEGILMDAFLIDECRLMIVDLGSSRCIEPDSSLRKSQINNRHSSILGVSSLPFSLPSW